MPIALAVAVLVASASLPLSPTVSASDSDQLTYTADHVTYDEWLKLCKRLELSGRFSVRPDLGPGGNGWCYLAPSSGELGDPHPVVIFSFHDDPEKAKASFKPNYTRHLYQFAIISVMGGGDDATRKALFQAAESIVDSLAVAVKPEPEEEPKPSEEPKDYRISITSTMIPFAATITVTDEEGNPAPSKAVQILVFVDDMPNRYWKGAVSKTVFPPDQQTDFATTYELIDLTRDAFTFMGRRWPRTRSTIDDHRRFRTDAKGSITVPLYGFTATDVGGYDLRPYLLRADSLTPSRKGLPFGLTVRATLFERDKGGDEKELATTEERAVLDHVAKLVTVRKGSDLDWTVLVQRGDVYRSISTANLRKPHGVYAAGYELRPGDVIHQEDKVETFLEWYFGANFSMIVREDRGPKEITVHGDNTSASWAVEPANALGWVAIIGGGVIGLLTTNPWVVAGGVGINSLLKIGVERIVGVDIVARSAVLADLTDQGIDIYTVEGEVEAYDRATGNMVEILAGQTVTLDPDTSFGHVAEFEVSVLDDELLSILQSVPPEPMSPSPTAETEAVTPSPSPTAETEAVTFEDAFDYENDGRGMLDYSTFANWIVESGTVDLIGNGYYDFYPDAGLYLDLDGSSNAGGTLVSRDAFALTPGHYRLEFNLAGNPHNGPDTVTVALGEYFVEDFTMPYDPDLIGFEHVVRDIEIGTESEARLSFQQHGADSAGVLLDDVRLSLLSSDGGDEANPPPTAAPVDPAPTSAEPTPTATPAPVEPTLTPVELTPAPAEPTPIPSPSVPTAAQGLWLHEGDTVTRVDHLSGEILERWDVSHPDCPSGHGARPYVQSDGEAAWIIIADAEWETPVLDCVIRLPLDGSTGLEAYPVPTGRKPTFVNAAATHGEDLWAITWKKKAPEATLAYYDDWSLARLDRWTGQLAQVLPRVVALAPTEAGLVVLYSEKGAKEGARRPLRLGIVEPGWKTPRRIPLDTELPRTKPGTYVTPRLRLSAGHEGTVALYDELAARDITVFDPASGAVIGQVSPPDGATVIGRVWPVSNGVWMSGLLDGGDDFVRYVPFDGWTSLDVDPCTDVAADCYAQVESASDTGAWISAWPYDDAFEVVLDQVVMRRYDSGGQGLAEVSGEELFGSR